MEGFSFWIIWAVLGTAMLIYYMRCRHTIGSMLWGITSGLAGLTLLHYFGSGIGFSPELNLFNIMQAGILGVPGVVMMAVGSIVL